MAKSVSFIIGLFFGVVVVFALLLWDLSSDKEITNLQTFSKDKLLSDYEDEIVGFYCKSNVENCTIQTADIYSIYADKTLYQVFVDEKSGFNKVHGRKTFFSIAPL